MLEQSETGAVAPESEMGAHPGTDSFSAAALEAHAVTNKTDEETIAGFYRALAQDFRRSLLDAALEKHRKGPRRSSNWHRRALPSLMAHVRPIGSKKKPFRFARIDHALIGPIQDHTA